MAASKEEIEKIKKQIATWQTRAEMARGIGSEELAQQALRRKAKYEDCLAELTGKKKAQGDS